jgi:hypothetical protein
VPFALSFLFGRENGLCPLELSRLPGFLPTDIERSISLLSALLAFVFSTSEETEN